MAKKQSSNKFAGDSSEGAAIAKAMQSAGKVTQEEALDAVKAAMVQAASGPNSAETLDRLAAMADDPEALAKELSNDSSTKHTS